MGREIIEFVRVNEEGLMIVDDVEVAYWVVRQLQRKFRMGLRAIVARIRNHAYPEILAERCLQQYATGTILGLVASSPSEWWDSMLGVGVARILNSRGKVAIELVFNRPWYLPKRTRMQESGLDYLELYLKRV